ncbi:unnamed protein product [Hermetia illucens]|uniref:Uncharacterized protein n=1 Tax=Hermetia illucens TaxID=343691 RepID=A0A7R8UY47_HERIL|nr:periodic tryptophan protein 1 homolog [Hermetia illucens]CAD7089295.1 unnamed protein product [Hermetia illucens]
MADEPEPNTIDFIPAICFVKRGVAKEKPDKVVLTPAELARVIADTKEEIDEAEEEDGNDSDDNENEAMETSDNENNEINLSAPRPHNEGDEFNMDNYDDDDSVQVAGLSTIAVVDENERLEDEEDSEAEDDIIKPTDNLLLLGHVADDSSTMEVWVFNEEEESLYPHHDFLLPSFPLCIEWLNHDPGSDKDGNMCAIGCMDPIITIWDLDIQDSFEPTFRLGSKGSRKKNKPKYGHIDAVLDLSWNINFPHVLASASVDQSVILWDLDEGQPHTTIKSFEEKVQSIEFHPTEPQNLLAGSCDGYVRLFDCRDPESECKKWKVEAEVEKVVWNPMNTSFVMAGTNDGNVHYIDIRKKKPLWSVKAHLDEISGICFNPEAKNMLITSSADGFCKIWKYSESELKQIYSHDFKLGRLQCMKQSPEDPFTFAFGGEKQSQPFKVYNIKNFEPVRFAFGIDSEQ